MLTGRDVLTSILTALSQSEDESNPPATQAITRTPRTKNALVTLHFLFPHELLPALDLIDRKLITQVRYDTSQAGKNPTQTAPTTQVMFFVQSASASINEGDPQNMSTGRFRNAYNPSKSYYEVDVRGWNCSCPAFAFSSMQLLADGSEVLVAGQSALDETENVTSSEIQGRMGCATVHGSVVPVCKHILAVSLCQTAPKLFGHAINHISASREEAAGWASV